MKRLLVFFGLLSCSALVVAQENHSLYDPNTHAALTSDRRSQRVGDLVTVLIYENASASSSADTQAGRGADVGVQATDSHRTARAAVSVNNEMDGRGRTGRSGRLLAQVTVTIRETLPNGDLRLEGQQVLEINDERQQIRLEGRVRSVDVLDGNRVLSSRLADARISYVGEGTLGDRQRPAWWQKVLHALGL